ncbi:hypothetical protein NDU88_002816 [Pleurodeles waltl]|uniref:Uncharacterized protein n=1 Tax=Pleurodeles waltl TaxID=8319 RepID=A0AAV7MYG8_PLEWA|nr:hypothetical protein NDU88_002816 [Pleurodeles waltl]
MRALGWMSRTLGPSGRKDELESLAEANGSGWACHGETVREGYRSYIGRGVATGVVCRAEGQRCMPCCALGVGETRGAEDAWDWLESCKAGNPWKGRQRKTKGRLRRPSNKTSQNSGGIHRLTKPTEEQVEEERESAILALATHRDSDHGSGLDINKMTIDSETERRRTCRQ